MPPPFDLGLGRVIRKSKPIWVRPGKAPEHQRCLRPKRLLVERGKPRLGGHHDQSFVAEAVQMAGMEETDGPQVRIAQIGHRYIKMSIGLEKIMQAPQGSQRIAHVLERMVARDEIEFFVAEINIRQRCRLHGDAVGPLAVACIAEARLDAINFESAPPRRHQKLAAAGTDIAMRMPGLSNGDSRDNRNSAAREAFKIVFSVGSSLPWDRSQN